MENIKSVYSLSAEKSFRKAQQRFVEMKHRIVELEAAINGNLEEDEVYRSVDALQATFSMSILEDCKLSIQNITELSQQVKNTYRSTEHGWKLIDLTQLTDQGAFAPVIDTAVSDQITADRVPSSPVSPTGQEKKKNDLLDGFELADFEGEQDPPLLEGDGDENDKHQGESNGNVDEQKSFDDGYSEDSRLPRKRQFVSAPVPPSKHLRSQSPTKDSAEFGLLEEIPSKEELEKSLGEISALIEREKDTLQAVELEKLEVQHESVVVLKQVLERFTQMQDMGKAVSRLERKAKLLGIPVDQMQKFLVFCTLPVPTLPPMVTPAPAPETKKPAPKQKRKAMMRESFLIPDDSTPLTIAEQTLVTSTIKDLDQDHLGGVMKIIREDVPVGANEDEIHFHIGQLNSRTQKKLLRHISKFVKEPQVKSKKANSQAKAPQSSDVAQARTVLCKWQKWLQDSQRPLFCATSPSIKIEHSAGVPRASMNEILYEKHGIFAMFGQSAFGTKNRKLSHMVMNNKWNSLCTNRCEHQKVYVGWGKNRRGQAQILEQTTGSFPLFFDPKDASDNCIFYVGHWKLIRSSVTWFDPPHIFMGEARCMYAELAFEKFDTDIVQAIESAE